MKQIDDRVEAAVNEEFEKLTPAQQCALMCSDDRVEAAVNDEFQKLTPAQQCALTCSAEALDKGIYFHISQALSHYALRRTAYSRTAVRLNA